MNPHVPAPDAYIVLQCSYITRCDCTVHTRHSDSIIKLQNKQQTYASNKIDAAINDKMTLAYTCRLMYILNSL